MGQVVDRFGSSLNNLSDAEKHVLYYIDNHFEAAKKLNLVQMAEAVNVSTTTVIRTCKKLGLAGFSELSYILRSLDADNALDTDNLVMKYIHNLHESLDNIDHTQLERMAHAMLQAKMVVVVSVGLTKGLGEYIGKRLIQIHKQTMYVYESHIIDLLPNLLHDNDVVLFISMSGETQTLVKAAEKLRFTGARLFSVTNAAGSTLSQLTHFNISTRIPTSSYSGYDITSRSPLVLLLDILIETYLKKMAESK
ncbi:MurR/RpiR family transcriptional regulator [Paenibacillus xerothermodurans]|uniref:MurR/RpiR family transcriptional regulator n=1 Tax=Paenibacillus xerothermodurans TaxID=1977292 RepID=A0A2W1NQL3_PAEXE|nr:MurR/RpiR family transcriptional regulator [Paenibacillus xerothermodurans]PZE21153.1 MurR/RpiR family transcriptional regulator [Paenibacillus xerothermodurans]